MKQQKSLKARNHGCKRVRQVSSDRTSNNTGTDTAMKPHLLLGEGGDSYGRSLALALAPPDPALLIFLLEPRSVPQGTSQCYLLPGSGFLGTPGRGCSCDSTLALAQCLAGRTLPVSICCQDWRKSGRDTYLLNKGLRRTGGTLRLPCCWDSERRREINAREGKSCCQRTFLHLRLRVQPGDSSSLASEPQGTACPNRACKDCPGPAKAEGQLSVTVPCTWTLEERRWARHLSPKGCACPPDRSSICKPMDRASL